MHSVPINGNSDRQTSRRMKMIRASPVSRALRLVLVLPARFALGFLIRRPENYMEWIPPFSEMGKR